MIRIRTLLALLLVAVLQSPAAAFGQDPPPTKRVVTIRGTAIAPSGGPAGDVPIVVKKFGRHRHVTLAEGRTGVDGKFELELDVGYVETLLVEFGNKRESDWYICVAEVQWRDEIDLKTVKLRPKVSQDAPKGNLCFAIATLLLGGPLGVLIAVRSQR